MDPATLVVTALASGAAKGIGEAATAAVKDAYQALRRMVSARFAGEPSRELVLAEYEKDPGTWQAPLVKQLAETGPVDAELVEAARRLLELLDAAGTRAGKYTVDLRGAQGVLLGDGGVQVNRFDAAPPQP